MASLISILSPLCFRYGNVIIAKASRITSFFCYCNDYFLILGQAVPTIVLCEAIKPRHRLPFPVAHGCAASQEDGGEDQGGELHQISPVSLRTRQARMASSGCIRSSGTTAGCFSFNGARFCALGSFVQSLPTMPQRKRNHSGGGSGR